MKEACRNFFPITCSDVPADWPAGYFKKKKKKLHGFVRGRVRSHDTRVLPKKIYVFVRKDKIMPFSLPSIPVKALILVSQNAVRVEPPAIFFLFFTFMRCVKAHKKKRIIKKTKKRKKKYMKKSELP